MAKLYDNTISLEEAKELIKILENEKEEAEKRHNQEAALTIVALIGLLTAIIAALSSKS